MGTDYWPDEDSNPIVHGLDIGFFYANAACTESKPVKIATGTAGYIKCQNGTAIGDAIGIALKTADAAEYVPVALSGVLKVSVVGIVSKPKCLNISSGTFLINSATDVVGACITYSTLKVFYGSSYVLGMALQPSTASGDEILMVLGKTA